MNLVFGPEIWELQSQGGISRYFFELIERAIQSNQFKVLMVRPDITTNVYWITLHSRYSSKVVDDLTFAEPKSIYHATYYSSENISTAKFYNYRVVLTVFDLISESLESSYSRLRRRNIQKAKSISLADSLLCISDSTKVELQHYYWEASLKSTVTHLGNSFSRVSQKSIPWISRRNQILYLGKRHGYKNFSLLLKAFKILSQRDDSLELILCGGETTSRKEKAYITLNNLSSKIRHIFPSDSELQEIFQESKFLVSTSKMEGFGLPLLEAASNGCLVFCSDIPVYREVASAFAHFFDCSSLESFINIFQRTIEQIQADPTYPNRFQQQVRKVNSRFTWASTFEATTSVYLPLTESRI